MANTTLEQMLESLLNDDQAKAEELFHDYVVNRSRDIYEGLIESELSDEKDDEEEVDESTDDKDVDEATDDKDEKVEEGSATIRIEADDENFGDEGDVEIGGDETDDLEGDIDVDSADEFDAEEEEKDPAELFQDLETIVDELQAKFDAIEGGEGELDDEPMGDEEGELGGEEEGEFGDEEEVDDSFDQELATVREYVEKIGAPKMGDNGANTKSPVAGKNDMGGTSANMTKGGESKSEGTKGGLADVTPKEDNAGNVNVPGGKAGKSAFKKKEPGHGAEKKGSGDNGENTTSLFRGKR